MAIEAQRRWSIEEYLAHERSSEVKSEYLDGELFAMSGASRQHNRITWNLVAALAPQLDRRGCEGFAADMRVRIPATGLYTYPDVVVVCGEPEFEDEELDTLLNPTLIIEVLSPSTEDYDHGRKFAHYRSLSSLKTYLLIAQSTVHVEMFVRQPDDRWILSETTEPTILELPGIGVSLDLGRVYERVSGLGERSRLRTVK